MGFMLGPASTDAVNRASRLSYGEATGITQTVRNYAASLGLAILGTILVAEMHSRADLVAGRAGRPARAGVGARRRAISQSQAAAPGGAIPHFVRLDFAYATRDGAARDGRDHGGGASSRPWSGCAAASRRTTQSYKRRELLRTALLIASTCAGVEPQQPPTICTPCST